MKQRKTVPAGYGLLGRQHQTGTGQRGQTILMTSVILPHRQTTQQTWQHGIPEFSAYLSTGRLFLGNHSHWETWENSQVDASKASEQLRVPGSIIVVTTINTTNTLLIGVSPQQLIFPSRSIPWYHLLKDSLLPTCYQAAHSHTRQVLVPSPWLSQEVEKSCRWQVPKWWQRVQLQLHGMTSWTELGVYWEHLSPNKSWFWNELFSRGKTHLIWSHVWKIKKQNNWYKCTTRCGGKRS